MNISRVRTFVAVAVGLIAAGSYAAAQQMGPHGPHEAADAPAVGPQHGMGMQHHAMMHGDSSCPMEEAAPIADIKVEKTADGAVIRLVAKKPEDVARIQQMAERMAEHMSSMEGHMGQGPARPASKPTAAAAPTKPPATATKKAPPTGSPAPNAQPAKPAK